MVPTVEDPPTTPSTNQVIVPVALEAVNCCFIVNVSVVTRGLIAKLVPLPVPVIEMVCGLGGASSVIVTAAVRVPVVVGENVMLTAQFAPAANEEPQLFVCAKSPLFDPVTAMLDMCTTDEPTFVTVTC